MPGFTVYAAAKSGLHAFSEALRRESRRPGARAVPRRPGDPDRIQGRARRGFQPVYRRSQRPAWRGGRSGDRTADERTQPSATSAFRKLLVRINAVVTHAYVSRLLPPSARLHANPSAKDVPLQWNSIMKLVHFILLPLLAAVTASPTLAEPTDDLSDHPAALGTGHLRRTGAQRARLLEELAAAAHRVSAHNPDRANHSSGKESSSVPLPQRREAWAHWGWPSRPGPATRSDTKSNADALDGSAYNSLGAPRQGAWLADRLRRQEEGRRDAAPGACNGPAGNRSERLLWRLPSGLRPGAEALPYRRAP